MKGRRESANTGLERRTTARFGGSDNHTVADDSNVDLVDETPVKNGSGNIIDLDFSPSLVANSQTPQPDHQRQFQNLSSPRMSRSRNKIVKKKKVFVLPSAEKQLAS